MRPASVCLLLSLWLLHARAATSSSLSLLVTLYRHGERTPVVVCPTDAANSEHFLQAGLGQLTIRGMRMHYELGSFLRARYTGFLHEQYHPNYTVVRAANYDRTLMSAQVNLAGLYPPHGEHMWNQSFPWQPIPVHTRPLDEDFLLEFPVACPRYVKHLQAINSMPEVVRLLAIYKPVFEYVSERCGTPVNDIESGMLIYDLLDIERRNNMTLPSWATETLPSFQLPLFPDVLYGLDQLSFRMLGYTAPLRRLGGGALLAEILSNLGAAVAGTLQPPQRQMFAYSGHDSDISALLATLGAYNDIPPPLASCLLFELHNATTDRPFVRILYRNDTARDPYPLTLPVCQHSDCPWSTLERHFTPLVPVDIRAECALPHPKPDRQESTIIVLVVALALLLTLVFAFCVVRLARHWCATGVATPNSLIHEVDEDD